MRKPKFRVVTQEITINITQGHITITWQNWKPTPRLAESDSALLIIKPCLPLSALLGLPRPFLFLTQSSKSLVVLRLFWVLQSLAEGSLLLSLIKGKASELQTEAQGPSCGLRLTVCGYRQYKNSLWSRCELQTTKTLSPVTGISRLCIVPASHCPSLFFPSPPTPSSPWFYSPPSTARMEGSREA